MSVDVAWFIHQRALCRLPMAIHAFGKSHTKQPSDPRIDEQSINQYANNYTQQILRKYICALCKYLSESVLLLSSPHLFTSVHHTRWGNQENIQKTDVSLLEIQVLDGVAAQLMADQLILFFTSCSQISLKLCYLICFRLQATLQPTSTVVTSFP